jgi:Zn-dependent M16 (insulinase) family peptidase
MSQEEEIYLKYESLIEEHDLDESQFSERLQQKIQQIEDLCDAFEDCEEEEEDEILLKIQAMDDGICADLDSIIAKMKDDEEDEEPKDNKMSDGGQTNTNSDAPSWRFWM